MDPRALARPRPVRPLPAPGRGDKLRRAAWNLVRATLYRLSPTPLFPLRRALLRLFGARIAAGARPYPGAVVWAPWNLAMERGSCLADGAICYNVATVTIGRDAIVSQRASLCTPGHDIRDPGFPLVAAPIRIEPGAWVAAEAFVGPGVVVGRGAVVGARAVVFGSVPEDAVVTGNPARVTGVRHGPRAPDRSGAAAP